MMIAHLRTYSIFSTLRWHHYYLTREIDANWMSTNRVQAGMPAVCVLWEATAYPHVPVHTTVAAAVSAPTGTTHVTPFPVGSHLAWPHKYSFCVHSIFNYNSGIITHAWHMPWHKARGGFLCIQGLNKFTCTCPIYI